MIIEFVGLPGSGKSTQHTRLCAHLRSSGFSVICRQSELTVDATDRAEPRSAITRRRVQAVRNKVWTAVRYRGLLILATRVLLTGQRPLRQKLLALRFILASLERYTINPDPPVSLPQIQVIDEGLLQRSFLLFVNADGVTSLSDQAAYMRLIPLPDVLVYLEIDPVTVLERLPNRARGLPPRLVGLDVKELTRVLQDSTAMWENAIRHLELSCRTTVLRVDARSPADELTVEINQRIARHLAPQKQGL